MSEAVSALNGATYDGFVSVAEAGLRGMITLRCDLSDAEIKNAVREALKVNLPNTRGITMSDALSVAWMSPDELLIMVPYEVVQDRVQALSIALEGHHHLVANVSDARAVFRIEGQGAAEVLAKLTPFDVEHLEAGLVARSRAAQVAAAFWKTGDDAFEMVCFRSVAGYVFKLLSNAAKPGGEVGYLSN